MRTPRFSHPTWGRIVLYLIVILAACLRLHELTRFSLWHDEIVTLENSAGRGLEHLRLAGAGLLAPPPDAPTVWTLTPPDETVPFQWLAGFEMVHRLKIFGL